MIVVCPTCGHERAAPDPPPVLWKMTCRSCGNRFEWSLQAKGRAR